MESNESPVSKKYTAFDFLENFAASGLISSLVLTASGLPEEYVGIGSALIALSSTIYLARKSE